MNFPHGNPGKPDTPPNYSHTATYCRTTKTSTDITEPVERTVVPNQYRPDFKGHIERIHAAAANALRGINWPIEEFKGSDITLADANEILNCVLKSFAAVATTAVLEETAAPRSLDCAAPPAHAFRNHIDYIRRVGRHPLLNWSASVMDTRQSATSRQASKKA